MNSHKRPSDIQKHWKNTVYRRFIDTEGMQTSTEACINSQMFTKRKYKKLLDITYF